MTLHPRLEHLLSCLHTDVFLRLCRCGRCLNSLLFLGLQVLLFDPPPGVFCALTGAAECPGRTYAVTSRTAAP